MTKAIALAGFIVATAVATSSVAAECPRKLVLDYKGVQVWRSGPAIGFARSGLAVDADGAPNSYRVDGDGLSYTCDGVAAIRNGVALTPPHVGWQKACVEAWTIAQQTKDYSKVSIFGFKHDCSGPCIQKQGDPLPGQAYITTTSLSVPGTSPNTQRHYVNASEIPYIVLPGRMARQLKINYGDVAAVYRPKTDTVAYGVYADAGPALGEGSVKLHQDLKSDPIRPDHDGVKRAKAGIEDRIVTVVFPGKRPRASKDTAAWYKQIREIGSQSLREWGGEDMLRVCAK